MTKEQQKTKAKTTLSLATVVERRDTTHHRNGTKGQSYQYNSKGQLPQNFQPQYNGGKGKGAGKQCNQGWNNYKYNKGAGKNRGESRPEVFKIVTDNTYTRHEELDTIQFQACSPTEQLKSKQLGTPSQPVQSQMGMLYNVGGIQGWKEAAFVVGTIVMQ
eukprot:2424332-Amphidinium_carterae.2